MKRMLDTKIERPELRSLYLCTFARASVEFAVSSKVLAMTHGTG